MNMFDYTTKWESNDLILFKDVPEILNDVIQNNNQMFFSDYLLHRFMDKKVLKADAYIYIFLLRFLEISNPEQVTYIKENCVKKIEDYINNFEFSKISENNGCFQLTLDVTHILKVLDWMNIYIDLPSIFGNDKLKKISENVKVAKKTSIFDHVEEIRDSLNYSFNKIDFKNPDNVKKIEENFNLRHLDYGLYKNILNIFENEKLSVNAKFKASEKDNAIYLIYEFKNISPNVIYEINKILNSFLIEDFSRFEIGLEANLSKILMNNELKNKTEKTSKVFKKF